MERSLFAACFLALVMASTAFAQPAKKAAPASARAERWAGGCDQGDGAAHVEREGSISDG